MDFCNCNFVDESVLRELVDLVVKVAVIDWRERGQLLHLQFLVSVACFAQAVCAWH